MVCPFNVCFLCVFKIIILEIKAFLIIRVPGMVFDTVIGIRVCFSLRPWFGFLYVKKLYF